MAVILHIDTSTTVCSVALSSNGVCLEQRIDFQGQSHARLLPQYVQQLLAYAQEQGLKIDAVAVSCGPGSYTGLRIGVSTAKGLCYGLNVPLIAISTLQIMANEALTTHAHQIAPGALLCPMIDARRMEVYAAVYNSALTQVRDINADIVDEHTYEALLQSNAVCFFGDGAAKCKEVITSVNARFIDEVYPTATAMIPLAEAAYAQSQFEDIAYFEPFYLKQFIATLPKQLL